MTIPKFHSSTTSVNIASENANLDQEDAFGDAEALRQAFRDPRYSKSASYRQFVADAIAESAVVTASDAGTTRYQVRGQPVDEAPPVDRELSAHDAAMIAKAAKHGL